VLALGSLGEGESLALDLGDIFWLYSGNDDGEEAGQQGEQDELLSP
jgi:hypothetical protein